MMQNVARAASSRRRNNAQQLVGIGRHFRVILAALVLRGQESSARTTRGGTEDELLALPSQA